MRTPCFVLLHSPLVGPATWRWTGEALERRGADVVVPSMLDLWTQPAPYWQAFVAEVQRCVPARADVVFVAHSGAGPYVPLISATLTQRPQHQIFVDARLPAPPGGMTAPDPEFRSFVASLAHDGTVPPWSEWWGADAMRALVPDAQRRALIEAELQALPLAFFDEQVPSPAQKIDNASYLQFSDAYAEEAEAAASRGWSVDHLQGGHLHMAVDPDAVADRLLDQSASS